MKRKRVRQERRTFTGPIHGRIADLRKRKGWTLEELAAKLGVDKSAVHHWETGFSRPEIGRLPAIASAFGIDVDELIRGEKAA